MDAEFILVYNDTKISKKYFVLAEKWQFFQRVLKLGDFGQNVQRGDPLQNSRNRAFFGLKFASFKK